jgi:uncharacterized protein
MSIRTKPRRPVLVAPWRTREIVLVVLLWLGLSVAVYLPFRLTRPSTDIFEGYVITTGVQAVEKTLLVVASLVAVWLVARRKDAPLHHTVGLRGLSRRWWIVTGLFPVLLLADRLLVPWWFGGTAIDRSMLPPQFAADGFSGIWLAVNLVLTGLLVPIEEEILYRGVVYGWLRSWAPKVPAILVSAAIFALVQAELGGMIVILAILLGLIAP